MWRKVKVILYKLKTGIQWEYSPVYQFFGFTRYRCQSVYYHFNKWSQTGEWERRCNQIRIDHRIKSEMSIVNFGGTHSPTKQGDEAVGYRRRKKCKTSNNIHHKI